MKYPEVLLPIPMETNRRVTRSSAAFSNQDLENMEIKKLAVSRTAPPTPSTSNQNDSDSPPVARAHTKNGVKKPAPKKPKLGPKTKKRPPGKFRIAYTNRKAIKLLSESGNNELSMDSMSFLTDEEKLFLSSWGLPSQVLAKYRQKGVTSLFQWQLDCLDNEKVLKGSNIVYSAPTSAGKTLVAEILMLKRVLELGKKAIIILPFVSVAREKMYSLQELFGDVGIRVEGFMGSYNPPGGFQQVDIAVCTIEKANSLINRLLEEGGLSQLGTVVVDELHLIGDPHRGYLLELLLTKIRFASSRNSSLRNSSMTLSLSNASISHHDSLMDGSRRCGKLNIQIIGMSATLPNLSTLAKWLDAELVVSDFRPVPLVEHIKIDDSLFDASLERVGPVLKDNLLALSNDPHHITSLSLETILDGHSILIFCPSKQMCESVAVQIAREFFGIGNPNIMSGRSVMLGEKLRQQLHASRISEVLAQLAQCPSGLDEALRKAVSFGVAFHHAGLTFDERDIIESAFKRGIIRVMVATSTLSAGVNLPARRVLIVTPTFDALDVLTYRQMSGRAGRKGVDTQGESILICEPKTQRRALGLIQASLPPVSSALLGANGSVSMSMKRALLEVIASGVVQSPTEVTEYTKCTLLYQIDDESEVSGTEPQNANSEMITKCLEFLERNDFIRIKEYESEGKSPEYMTTQLGSACLASSLSPDEGIIVFKELQKARRCFVLENELHVIYQVTPIYIAEQWRNLDWNQYLTIWQNLSSDQKEVGKLIGVQESFILKAMIGVVSRKNPSQVASLDVHQRFFTALALNDLVNEMPISQVTEKYSVNKGVVQNLQQAASTFAGMVTAFCNRLGWSNLELLLSQFQERLQFGVQRELVDLVRLDLLNGQRARILHNAGIKTIPDLATSEPATIAQIFHQAGPFSSNAHGGQSARSIWMLGKDEGLTENQAAQMIVHEARNFLQIELGLAGVKFRNEEVEDNSDDKENRDIVEEEEMESDYIDPEIIITHDEEGMEVLNNSVIIPTVQKNDSSRIHQTFRDDSADPILSGFCNTPRIQLDSPVTTVTALVSALKHSTPVQNQIDSPTRAEMANQKSAIIPVQMKTDEDQEIDEFDYEKEFLHSKFDTSVFLTPADDVEAEAEGYMHLLTTSFMDVSLDFSSNDEAEAAPGLRLEKQQETDERVLLSESILAAAAAIVAEDDDSDSSIECFPPSPPERTVFPRPPGTSEQLSTSRVDKLSVSVHPDPIPSDDDEDAFEVFTLKNRLTPNRNYFQQQSVIHVFGREFKVNKILRPELLPENAFRSKEAIGFGLTVAPPPPRRMSNGIGNRVLGRRPSMSTRIEKTPHSLAFCNASTDTIWTYEWNVGDEGGLRVLMKKFASTSSALSILSAKDKFKLLLENSQVQLSQLPNEKRIWDPKIGQWLLRFDEDRAISQDEMVRLWIDPEDARQLHSYRGQSRLSGKMEKGVVEALIGWKLMEVLREKLTVAGLWEHFLEIETQSTRALLLMELNGFKINPVELQRIKEMLEFNEAILELSAYRIAGRQFNMSSSKHISQILCHDLGLGDEMKGCSTGKDILKKVDHEFARVILEWRKVTGALRKIVVPFLAENVAGRIHGHYTHFTVTGRVVMAEPSLQCVPRDFSLALSYTEAQLEEIRHHARIKFGNKVALLLEKIQRQGGCGSGEQGLISLRNAFIPSKGFLLLSADYSQLELRILAHLAQEKKLLRILNTPTGDVFREIAAQWKCVQESEVTEEMRQEAKGITYGVIYGMGAKTLSDQLGVDERAASEFIRAFMWAYPGIRTFIDQTIKSCREFGFVETISGRRRYLEHINSNNATQRAQAERQAVNSRIQGSASDLVKNAMTQIQRRLANLCPGSANHVKWSSPDAVQGVIAFPVLNLHDELIYEVRESHLSSIGIQIKQQMESCLQLDVNTPVVLKTGPSWGQLRPYSIL